MPIKCDEYNDVCVISIGGDLNGPDAAALRKAVDDRTDGPTRVSDFVIDFGGVGFISGQGLESLLAVRRRCEARASRVKLAALDDNCRKILEMTRLDHRFDCSTSVEAALKGIR